MTTVGKYLVSRLEQAGVRHIFGVPGDYVLRFFDDLEASRIRVVGNCNELNAGYAADAYARLNGIGAVCVTYGVGGFSLLNAAVGAFAERVPLIIISGGPKVSEHRQHHLLHHTIGDLNLQSDIYKKIAAASAILLNPEEAPQQIDETIAACLRFRRPVYIEIPTDIVAKPCKAPAGVLRVDTVIPSDPEALEESVCEAAGMLEHAKAPAILAGVEVHRLGIRGELQGLIDHAGYPFTTTLLGKTVIPEKHPQFCGVYNGAIGLEGARKTVEDADVLLSLGALMTDVNLGIGTAKLDASKMIVANSDKVRVKHHVYEQVSLRDFINSLRAKLQKGEPDLSKIEHASELFKKDFTPVPEQKMTLARFYARVNRFIRKGHVIIADAGDSLFCSAELFLPEGVEFIGQAFYLSIGYSVPASLGAQLADSGRKPLVFVGDGAFQMTAQEISTLIRQKLDPVIFLMNNSGYTIERVIDDGVYNDIQSWKYHLLPGIFGGGWGCEVRTEGDLEKALKKVEDSPGELAFIEVHLDKMDCSEALKKLGKELSRVNAGG